MKKHGLRDKYVQGWDGRWRLKLADGTSAKVWLVCTSHRRIPMIYTDLTHTHEYASAQAPQALVHKQLHGVRGVPAPDGDRPRALPPPLPVRRPAPPERDRHPEPGPHVQGCVRSTAMVDFDRIEIRPQCTSFANTYIHTSQRSRSSGTPLPSTPARGNGAFVRISPSTFIPADAAPSHHYTATSGSATGGSSRARLTRATRPSPRPSSAARRRRCLWRWTSRTVA
jgi:hypothetical protein